MWFADPQTTGTVGAPLLETLCWHWIQSKGPSALGVVCGKPRGFWVWFSEPPNKELAESLGKALGWAQAKDALYPGIWLQWQ